MFASEWQVIGIAVAYGLIGAACVVLLPSGIIVLLVVLAAAQHGKGFANHFSGVTLVAVFIFPRAGAQFPFNIDLHALLQILLSHIGQAAPQNNIMPFGLLLAVPVLVLIRFGGGDG